MSASMGVPLPQNRWDLLDGVAPSDPPSVSVIIAHYEQPAQLALTLAALRGSDHPSDRMQVIVADDGSSTAPVAPDDVEVVTQADRGFRLAATRNLGAARATGEVLVFLDADTVPEPSFVTEITRLPALAPDVVAVGRRRHAALAGVPPVADIRAAASARALPEPGWLRDAYAASRNLLDADDRSYRFVIGAVVACSRRLFSETGGFDEAFTAYGGEDWEWSYRAWIKGAVLAHVPSAVAWHDGPDASGRAGSNASAKNAEALVLADLVPVPGSRPRGIRPTKVDVAVTAPIDADPAERFLSVDSVLAALPTGEHVSAAELGAAAGAHDRIRIHVEIVRPLRVVGPALAGAVEQVTAEALGVLVVTDRDGDPLLRIISMRARSRARRWRRDDLFPTVTAQLEGVVPLPGDIDVEGYLGGWA